MSAYNMERPKRPKNPFFKYKDENFKRFQREHPELKGIQVVPLIAKEFKQLPPETRQAYETIYKKELEDYKKLKRQMINMQNYQKDNNVICKTSIN